MNSHAYNLRAAAPEFRVGSTGMASSAQYTTTALRISASEFVPGVSKIEESDVTNTTARSSGSCSRGVDDNPMLNPGAKLFRPGTAPTTANSIAGSHTDHNKPDSLSLDASATCFVPPSRHRYSTGYPGSLTISGAEASFGYSGPLTISGSDSRSRSGIPSTPKKTPICRFFQQGACRRGLQCTFSHEITALDRRDGEGIVCRQSPRQRCNVDDGKAKINDAESLKVVDNGIRCHFGPGLGIRQLQLGSPEENCSTEHDGTRVVISGLSPNNTSDFDLEARLSTFGSICSLHRKHASYAYCTFESSKQAADAVAALNGTPLNTWNGLAGEHGGSHTRKDENEDSGFVSVSLASEVRCSSTSSRNATVKLLWYGPSRVAWLHFHKRSLAERAAKSCHGRQFCRRTVSVKLQKPSFNQTRSFSVWMGGLGEDVNTTQLSHFVERHAGAHPASLHLEDPPFRDKEGAQVVRQLLISEGGPLTQFDEDQDNCRFPYNLKRKALARFTKAEDAACACAFFQSTSRVPGLGGTKVHCQRVFSAKYTLPTSIFTVIRDSLTDVFQSKGQDLRFNIFHNSNNTSSILVHADDANNLAAAKSRLSDIVDGKLVLDPFCKREQKVPLWKDCFGSKETETNVNNKICQRFGYDCVTVLFQKRRREVRLFARTFVRQKAIEFVSTMLCDMKPEVQGVPISPARYKFMVAGGRGTLDTLITACHGVSISLDMKNHALLVEGSRSDARRAVACLAKMMEHGESSDGNEEPCPVCFCTPGECEDEPIVQLQCFHRYCRDCFLAWLCKGTQTCDFPIRCLADGCGKEVELDELEKALPRPDFLSLLRSAVDMHVLSHQSSLQFCLSPGCSGIYALPSSTASHQDPSPSRTAMCSTCHMVICCPCKATEHEGLTCEQHKLTKLPPNRLRNHIVEEILTLKCPRCKQAFLDFDGCFALTCSSCRCGFCGWCLKDCGSDAHPHLLSCPSKPKEARNATYFGSKEQFEEAQRDRRRHDLKTFLSSLSGPNEKHEALQAIEQDLKDLKLNDVAIHSL